MHGFRKCAVGTFVAAIEAIATDRSLAGSAPCSTVWSRFDAMNGYERARHRVQVIASLLYFGALVVFVGGAILLFTLLANEQRFHGYYDYASGILVFGGPALGAASVLFGAGAIVQTLTALADAREEQEWSDDDPDGADELS
jgi:hypothetical protein